MKRIGILSDTHTYVHPEMERIFSACDEIWHAGDFGNMETVAALQAMKPLRGVYGNVDSQEIRAVFPRVARFFCEEVDVLITHIGGYPGRYESGILEIMKVKPPDLFISGHSHILKVMPDKRFNLLHINPGAAGKQGLHHKITFVRFVIDGKTIQDLEVVEFNKI